MVDDARESDRDPLATRIRALEDKSAIERVIANYGFYADSGQHEAFVDLFHPDGVLEIFGGEASGTYGAHVQWEGHHELRAFITDPKVHLAIEGMCMHLPTLNLRIDVNGNAAAAESSSLVLLRRDGQIIVNGAGFTRWTLAKSDMHWRITRRTRHAIGDGITVLQQLHGLSASE